MDYPTWVPQYLCEQHKREYRSSRDHGNTDKTLYYNVLNKLVGHSGRTDYDDDIKHVWERLEKEKPDDEDYSDLYLLIIQASAGPGEWEKKTKVNQREKLKKISEVASSLSNLLKNTPLDRTPYIYFSEQDSERLLNDLDPAQYSENTHKNNPTHTLDENLPTITKMSTLLWKLSRTSEAERNILYGDTQLWDPELIGNDSGKSPGIRKFNEARFVFILSKFFHQRFEQPFHDVVESLTRVIFENPEIDYDFVIRHAWKEAPPS